MAYRLKIAKKNRGAKMKNNKYETEKLQIVDYFLHNPIQQGIYIFVPDTVDNNGTDLQKCENMNIIETLKWNKS
jgi:hypothetical protein